MKLFHRLGLKIKNIWKSFKKAIFPVYQRVNKKRKNLFQRFMNVARKRPVATFLALLGVLLLLIIISNVINKPKVVEQEIALPTKIVTVYTIGQSPKITLQAQVEKSGVIKVVALGAGVVQNIGVQVGQTVNQGTPLVSMSTNYQGGNAFSVARQLAQVQYKNVTDTYKVSKDLIKQQIDLANKTDENSDKMRQISNDSISSTQSLIDLNNSILSSLNSTLATLEAGNVNGSNDAQILGTKQMISQLEAGNNQLQTGLNAISYTSGSDNAPAQISNITKTITLEQLYIQNKALDLNREVSALNVQLAQINEAIMFPSSPIAGTVERIYVKEGQVVTPGTPLMQISGASDSLIAVVPMSQSMANGVSRSIVSTIFVGNQSYQAVPFYVSQDATDGSLFTAQYVIPQELNSKVTDREFLIVQIPVSYANTSGAVPFIPLDSVFQTQDRSYVFIVKDGVARSRRVVLGQVMGSYVEVKTGLGNNDQVILNRNVIDGDPVKVSN